MSQASSGFPQQHGVPPQSPMDYIPTEEERRVFRECNQESFWYRSLPFSAVSMAVTQGLISRGVLTSNTRFGAVSKLAFAGLCGYLAGKMSYMKICREKFKNLENSPLGEVLRQGHHTLPPRLAPQNQTEFEDASQPAYEPPPSLPSPDQPSPAHSYADFSYSDSAYQPAPSESAPSRADDDIISPQAPPYLDEEKPKRSSTSYDELRSKNRENYEVTMTQKAETLLKPAPDRATPDRTTPRKEVKKNIYGDTWEE
ncbi:hypothetical protein AAFF_G00437730 [Aldrovandia affinis]|uniref:OCIA domain-containing protein 1 n=1 Tax=Aldrovandia affinis TaxID=143900 RepID=A0AAD7WHU4_9TELE|nr:hypothetical protein AAFF_G00437730 [Aldrovandia affinis]